MNAIAPEVKKLRPNPDWAGLALFDRKCWKTMRFGDVVENVNETERAPAEAGIERFIGLEHLEPGSLHIRTWGNVADGTTFTRRCQPGQVLFGKRRAYQRKVAVAEFDAVVSGDIYVLAPKGDRLLPELLPFLCLSERFFQHAVGTSAGSLSPRTNWSSLSNFEFALPPLDQQRRIADILWAVDEAMRHQEALKNSIKDGLCAERNAFFFKAQEVKTEPVENLFQVQLGKMLSPKSKQGISPLPYLGNKNVQWGRFDLSEVQEMDFSPKEVQKFKLQPGDLLVCEGGEVGRSAIWDGQIKDCCFQKAIHRLRPLDGTVTTDYMFEFMMWGSTKGMFSSLTGHSTIAHLTAIKLKSLGIPVVSRVKQQGFMDRISGFRYALNAVQTHQEQTVRLRVQLLQQIE